jgi:hypothetical protein
MYIQFYQLYTDLNNNQTCDVMIIIMIMIIIIIIKILGGELIFTFVSRKILYTSIFFNIGLCLCMQITKFKLENSYQRYSGKCIAYHVTTLLRSVVIVLLRNRKIK